MGSSAGLLVRCVPDVLVHNGRAVELLFPPPDRCNFRCISTQAAELHLKDDKMTPMQYFVRITVNVARNTVCVYHRFLMYCIS